LTDHFCVRNCSRILDEYLIGLGATTSGEIVRLGFEFLVSKYDLSEKQALEVLAEKIVFKCVLFGGTLNCRIAPSFIFVCPKDCACEPTSANFLRNSHFCFLKFEI